MDAVTIGDRRVGADHSPYVIAEAGSNHDGDFDLALDLIDEAAAAGADAVKFQTFRKERLYAAQPGDEDPYASFADLEMPYDWIPDLRDRCADRGVHFLSTPFDERSARELAPHVPAFKVASPTLSHHPFLETLAGTGLPLIVSTGAHTMGEVETAVAVLRDAGAADLVLLHCVSAYPTSLDDINVRVVGTLGDAFGVPVGLSDHTVDPVTAPAATVAVGGSVIEKHFTLDSTMEGPDHSMSVEPDGLRALVAAARDTHRALGSPEKRVLDAERAMHDTARRAVHATRAISAGERIAPDAVAVLRSGERDPGVEPSRYGAVVGSRATRDLDAGEGVGPDDFE